jgi:hypothetical protein
LALEVEQQREGGASERAILDFLRRSYRLAYLTKDEKTDLNRCNRSNLDPDRLRGIIMADGGLP